MKIKINKKSTKITIILVASSIVILGVVWLSTVMKNNRGNNYISEDYSLSGEKEVSSDKPSKDSPVKNEEKANNDKETEKIVDNNSDTPLQPTVDKQTQKTRFNINSSIQIEDGKVRLAAIIDALYIDEGECRFILTHVSGSRKVYDAGILLSPQHRHCSAKEVLISELGQSGEWVFRVEYNNDNFNYEGKSDEKKFTIEL